MSEDRHIEVVVSAYNEEKRIGVPELSHSGAKRTYVTDWETCMARTGCVVMMVRHSQYRGLDLARFAELMRMQVLVDGRSAFDKDEALRAGLIYKGVGDCWRLWDVSR
jgi:UDP-N-acetyl-D-mannosaminuronate dehydrogenase